MVVILCNNHSVEQSDSERRNKMKKRIVLLVALMGLFFLASCGTAPTPTPTEMVLQTFTETPVGTPTVVPETATRLAELALTPQPTEVPIEVPPLPDEWIPEGQNGVWDYLLKQPAYRDAAKPIQPEYFEIVNDNNIKITKALWIVRNPPLLSQRGIQ